MILRLRSQFDSEKVHLSLIERERKRERDKGVFDVFRKRETGKYRKSER